MELEQELSRLRLLESEYRYSRYRLQDKINTELPQRINCIEIHIENVTADIATRDANTKANFFMKLGNKEYMERKPAGDMLLAVAKSSKYHGKIVGSMNGFDLITAGTCPTSVNQVIVMRGQGNYNVELSASELGSITRLENFFKSLDRELHEAQEPLTALNNELATAKIETTKSFDHAETITQLTEQLTTLNAQLDLGRKEIAATVIDEDTCDEPPTHVQQDSQL